MKHTIHALQFKYVNYQDNNTTTIDLKNPRSEIVSIRPKRKQQQPSSLFRIRATLSCLPIKQATYPLSKPRACREKLPVKQGMLMEIPSTYEK